MRRLPKADFCAINIGVWEALSESLETKLKLAWVNALHVQQQCFINNWRILPTQTFYFSKCFLQRNLKSSSLDKCIFTMYL